MKKIFFILGIAVALFCSCGNKGAEDKKDTASSSKKEEAPKPIPLDTADWELKDLNTINPECHLTMRVPKNTKIEKNAFGGVLISINSFYQIQVSQTGSHNLKGGIDLAVFGDTMLGAHHFKMIHQDANGYVYSLIPKTEAGEPAPVREAHFLAYVQKDTEVYKIVDKRDNWETKKTPGSAFTEEIALKVYDIVKGPDKPKPAAKAKAESKGHNKGKKHHH